MMHNAIEIRNLTKNYKGFSLGPLDFTIPKGCMVGYIGENGAGKSTTLKAILGLIHADSGEIKIFGKSMNEHEPELMNKIGVVFDAINLPTDMKVQEVGTFCKLAFTTWEENTFGDYLKRFSLPNDKKVKALSRGMKMKLSLSIALSHQAELLILDEATSGLDPVVRDEILDILLDFLQDENHTVLISSHILSDLEKAADYIAFLHHGKLLFMEEKDLLVERYALCSLDDETIGHLDPEAIVGRRRHAFGQDLLVIRNLMPKSIKLTNASIEDIMVYIIKGVESESVAL